MSLDQLSKLLPLERTELQQILDYADTLSDEEAMEHFKSFLGNSPGASDFISTYNTQRNSSTKPYDREIARNTNSKPTENKTMPQTLPWKTPEILTSVTAYQKREEEDYILPGKGSHRVENRNTSSSSQSRAPPSAAGPLISDFSPKSGKGKANSGSENNSRNKSSKSGAKAKITIPGGQAMHGASTTISELDDAIRSLEISTNSSLKSQDPAARACNCIATRHPLLEAAPNCLKCGKVICVKEGLGPCTFCGAPLISAVEVQAMISSLKKDREREKIAAHNKHQRRPELASTPKPFSVPKDSASYTLSLKESKNNADREARAHRDRLLNFQAQNAQRTTVRDEVADFNIDPSEVEKDMMWSSPVERAKALKQQQKLLQEMQWNARPEYERRKVVVSLDVVGGKIIKKVEKVTKERDVPRDKGNEVADVTTPGSSADTDHYFESKSGGKYKKNPLLGGLIRPIWTQDSSIGKDINKEKILQDKCPKLKTWRRVQDNQEDNEEIILDGGLFSSLSGEKFRNEPSCV